MLICISDVLSQQGDADSALLNIKALIQSKEKILAELD